MERLLIQSSEGQWVDPWGASHRVAVVADAAVAVVTQQQFRHFNGYETGELTVWTDGSSRWACIPPIDFAGRTIYRKILALGELSREFWIEAHPSNIRALRLVDRSGTPLITIEAVRSLT